MAATGSGFVFAVDPHLTPSQAKRMQGFVPAEARARIIDWRLAHEIAHILFYREDGERVRLADEAEEAFCDTFAYVAAPLTRAG